MEIATYPEARLVEQLQRDTLTVLLDGGQVPEVLAIVLRPKGAYRVPAEHDLISPLGTTAIRIRWRVVELWNVPAADLLAAGDVGLIPWVPLTQFDGPPEPVLEQCRECIDQAAPADERPNLLAVIQVLTRLRYNDPQLLTIFGGSRAMIESPLIQELVAQTLHKAIIGLLEARFGAAPPEIVSRLRAILDEQELWQLNRQAGLCPNLEAFKVYLSSRS